MASDEVIEAAGYTSEVVLRHETGHCNGWPKDHAGSRMWVRANAKKAAPEGAAGMLLDAAGWMPMLRGGATSTEPTR
jgi:hypothetical protein